MPNSCSFCSIAPEEAWVLTEFVVAVPHPEPVSPCHLLVAPRRHVPAFYDLDVQEQQLLWQVVEALQKRIRASLDTQAFDVGFAEGEGDWHVHIHIVPRVPNQSAPLPTGIEWVDPDGA